MVGLTRSSLLAQILWEPVNFILRGILLTLAQEFGGAGCLDGAYALGLWHAGSSFRVATGVAMTPTSTSIHSQVSMHSHVHRPDGICPRKACHPRLVSSNCEDVFEVGLLQKLIVLEARSAKPRIPFRSNMSMCLKSDRSQVRG